MTGMKIQDECITQKKDMLADLYLMKQKQYQCSTNLALPATSRFSGYVWTVLGLLCDGGS